MNNGINKIKMKKVKNANGESSATGFCNELGGSYSQGLTKRELIAAMAMQGIIADGNSFTSPDSIADQAILFADELLKQLETE